MESKAVLLTYLMMFFAIFSCGQDYLNSQRAKSNKVSVNGLNNTTCECTTDVNKVCASNGMTYLNACYAQCQGLNYTYGTCSGSNTSTNTGCNQSSGPLCGQPPMPTCPEGMQCIQVMPSPVTYSNECDMQAAEASLLYSGNCQSMVVQ